MTTKPIPLFKPITVETTRGAVKLRAPDSDEFGRYVDAIGGGRWWYGAKMLVEECLVQPERNTWRAWADQSPGIVVNCAAALMAAAGLEIDE